MEPKVAFATAFWDVDDTPVVDATLPNGVFLFVALEEGDRGVRPFPKSSAVRNGIWISESAFNERFPGAIDRLAELPLDAVPLLTRPTV